MGESYREVAGLNVGLLLGTVALVGWYLPRWRRGFITAYRPTDRR